SPPWRCVRSDRMWEPIIQLVVPMAWDVVRDKLRIRRGRYGGAADRQDGDLQSRVLALQAQVDALNQAEAQHVEELTKVLKVIGLRATVALWLGISSAAASVATL